MNYVIRLHSSVYLDNRASGDATKIQHFQTLADPASDRIPGYTAKRRISSRPLEPIDGIAPKCSICGCVTLFEIEVQIEGHPMMASGVGVLPRLPGASLGLAHGHHEARVMPTTTVAWSSAVNRAWCDLLHRGVQPLGGPTLTIDLNENDERAGAHWLSRTLRQASMVCELGADPRIGKSVGATARRTGR